MGKRVDLLQGTLDLLILKAVSLGPLHGYGILLRIQQISGDRLEIQQGSFYPAIYRLEHQGWIEGEWGESENNRQAKFYRLTAAGKRQLQDGIRPVGQNGRSRGRHSDRDTRGNMSVLARLRTWWNAIAHATRMGSDVEAELQFHIDTYTEDLMQCGVSLPRKPHDGRAVNSAGQAYRKKNIVKLSACDPLMK